MKIFVFVLIILSLSCCKDKSRREVPVTLVDFKVYPYGLDNELNADGQYKYFPNRGYNGVIVLHLMSEFYAYDCACPNDYEYGCTVKFDRSTFTLRDSGCCNTIFNALSGFPESANNKSPLRRYQVRWKDNQTIQISN